MFLKVCAQSLTNGCGYGSGHFAVAKLCFGLAFKLRFHDLDGYYGCQTLAEVIAGDVDLHFVEQFLVFGIFFQSRCQAAAES